MQWSSTPSQHTTVDSHRTANETFSQHLDPRT